MLCCRSTDAVTDKSDHLVLPTSNPPPVSDHSLTLESIVEEENQNSVTKTSVRSMVKEETAMDRSTHSVPIIDASKQADANIPPASDQRATSESVVKKKEETYQQEADIAEKTAEKAAYNCFDFLFCFKDTNTVATVPETKTAPVAAKASTLATDDYYDFLAPSVFHLQTSLQERIKEAGLGPTATIYDIEDLRSDNHGIIRSRGSQVMCPIDGRKGAAYVQCLSGLDHVGPATHMLSYAWGYLYVDIVDTLLAYCKDNKLDPKRTYIWICCLCNNQHRVVEKEVPFENFKYVFNKRVKGIGNILAMMAPWTSPAYLTRVWCIFEMYSANSDDKCTIEIVMPPKEKRSLLNAVKKGRNAEGKDGMDDLFDTLANTKVELANASRPQDKVNILKLVDEGPGYNGLNLVINQLMRKWVLDTIIDSARIVEDMACTDDTELRYKAVTLAYYGSYFSKTGMHQQSLELHQKSLQVYKTAAIEDEECFARCYNNIGTEYESMGDYKKALEAHHKCLAIFESIFGIEHTNTSTCYFNIGFVHRKNNDNDKALEMFEKSLTIDKKCLGENHVDTAGGYTNIGRIKQHNEDYDGALEMFQKTLTIVEATYGKEHPETGICLGDMGLLHHLKKDYDAAIDLHKRVLTIQRAVLGELHPDTAQVYQNLGCAHYEKGESEKAVELISKAKAAFEESLGKDHPKSKVSGEWLELAETKWEEQKKKNLHRP